MSDFMLHDKKLDPLPDMQERPCKICGQLTVVGPTHTGDVYCIEHDPVLTEELNSDGI